MLSVKRYYIEQNNVFVILKKCTTTKNNGITNLREKVFFYLIINKNNRYLVENQFFCYITVFVVNINKIFTWRIEFLIFDTNFNLRHGAVLFEISV